MRFEQDDVTIVGGVRPARPGIAGGDRGGQHRVVLPDRWHEEMAVEPGETKAPSPSPGSATPTWPACRSTASATPATCRERASARETAARVAAGALAKNLLGHLGVQIVSHVVQLGSVWSKAAERPTPADSERVDASALRCFDQVAEEAMVDEVKAVSKAGDSLGGVVEVLAYGVPVGLGSHVHWDRRLDGLLAQALASIQAVSGVEVGQDGFDVAGQPGSELTTHLLTPGPALTGATPAGPAASRAASRPASWWCARWR